MHLLYIFQRINRHKIFFVIQFSKINSFYFLPQLSYSLILCQCRVTIRQILSVKLALCQKPYWILLCKGFTGSVYTFLILLRRNRFRGMVSSQLIAIISDRDSRIPNSHSDLVSAVMCPQKVNSRGTCTQCGPLIPFVTEVRHPTYLEKELWANLMSSFHHSFCLPLMSHIFLHSSFESAFKRGVEVAKGGP